MSNWNDKLARITILLKEFTNKNMGVKDYCELSECALYAPISYLTKLVIDFEKDPTSNKESIIPYLAQPNINFTPGSRQQDKKRYEEEIVEAGKRVTGLISYSWDYYFRLIKGMGKQDPLGIYSEKNIKLAAKRIEEMLRDIRGKKYRWEHYAKEEMTNQQQQQKEIQQEQTFAKLLQTMLLSQIDKILRAKSQYQLSKSVNLQQKSRQQLQSEQQQAQDKEDAKVLAKVEDYFKRKIIKMKEKPAEIANPIAKIIQQKKFNAAVLRYFRQTEI